MRPEQKSQVLLGATRSKAKMVEYGVPEEHHIKVPQNPAKLFMLSIGLLGDLSAAINREESNSLTLLEMRDTLLFSARFFDSYLQSRLNEELASYLVLLGAASYYLCELPGSASVLAGRIEGDCPDLDGDGLECLLLWLLRADYETSFEGSPGPFGGLIDGISRLVLRFFKDGTGEAELLNLVVMLRNKVYEYGTPRQLLFGDVIAAVVRKKLENSSWEALPLYSGLPGDKWLHALQKESFIKELWPAQHRLGEANVLQGKSAIVQMPTSAGKTKATELILRSAFLAGRVSLAIIIAPFRALCHEIKDGLAEAFHNESPWVDELSDALQTDFKMAEFLGRQQILVVTPEKLLYVLRHAPELATHVGLLIFDEGHQFDNGTRGITYELLLTSLRSMIPEGTQKVLISAVISNAKAIGDWLNGEANVVDGTTLIPTFRSVGFASWLDHLGRIEYVDSRDPEQKEFFVPRVIEGLNLGTRGAEKRDRFFPEQTDGQSIALYLGLKLARNGSVAVFCGTKAAAASVCEKAVDVIERGAPFALPSEFSDRLEVERLTHLHIENLGADATASQSAAHGIFSHHGNTPNGIRLAVEYAMREQLVRFVVCTSTLAQGVNLPIRYLIVTSVYQGRERIKVRDFHNLIGRAGRAGMHTEGSILFADPGIYDKRKVSDDKWRWEGVKELLDPGNSEPCVSNLLSIFEPIKSDDKRYSMKMEALTFAMVYVRNQSSVATLAAQVADRLGERRFSRDGVERQIAWRINLIAAVENFLLSHWDETENGLSEQDVTHLAEGTLAFFLADDEKKVHVRELFQLLAENIKVNIPDSFRRKVYGRTLYGVRDAQAIEGWVQLNAANLLSLGDSAEALDLTWALLTKHINDGVFAKFDNPDVRKDVARGWIDGKSFSDILSILRISETKMIWGTKRRKFKIDHVVEVCEGTLAYEGALLIGALCEFIEATLDLDVAATLLKCLQIFQKRLKYGLPTETTIGLYELGFSDRVISQDLAASLSLSATQKEDLVTTLKQVADLAVAVMEKYPSYFRKRMDQILR